MFGFLYGAENERHSPVVFRGQRQAAQIGIACAAKPDEYRSTGACPQGLFRGPQGVQARRDAYDGEAGRLEARRGERGCVGQIRRGDPCDAMPGCGKRRQCRQDELKLADSFARIQDLGQSAARPAASGQFMIEHGEPRRHHPRHGLNERGAAPYGLP